MPLLEVRGLEKWYGRRQVVMGVDFNVDRGEVVGLLGPNGAGKTTSFRMTIGLIDADGGSVMFDGRDVTKMPMYLRARAGMGYLAQDSSVFKQLTVEENLMAILETRRMSRRQRKDRQNELLDQFGLTKIRKTKAQRVSGGERRRLEIARSLITEPKLIMLDEPFAGIDPKTVAEIQDQIRNLVDTYHIGILLTDHQFRETVQVSDRIYVIREGRVFAYGNREQIVNNPEVRRHYIGERYDVGHLLDDQRPTMAIGQDPTPQRGDDESNASEPPESSPPRAQLPPAKTPAPHFAKPVPTEPANAQPPARESTKSQGPSPQWDPFKPRQAMPSPEEMSDDEFLNLLGNSQMIVGRFDDDDQDTPPEDPNRGYELSSEGIANLHDIAFEHEIDLFDDDDSEEIGEGAR
jgi:lipopolysaccharide export system ATP-binding protein